MLVKILKYCKTCKKNHIVGPNKKYCPTDGVTKLLKERDTSKKKSKKSEKPKKLEVVVRKAALKKATKIDEVYFKPEVVKREPKTVIQKQESKDYSRLETVIVNNVEEPSIRYKVGYVYQDGSSNIRNKTYFKNQLPALVTDIKRNPNKYDRYGKPVIKLNIIEIKVKQIWKNKPLKQVYATIVKSILIS